MSFTVKNLNPILNLATYLPALGSSLLLSFAVGCNGGDRANNGGECPDDEVCSSKTPEGLYFRSYGYANRGIDTGPEVTAVGGSQSVDLYSKALISLPLSFAFGIDTGTNVTALAKGPHAITLTGAKVGSNYIRITDPDDGTLFDRISVGAAALNRIAVVGASEPALATDNELAFTQQSALAIELFDKDNRHLVDEGAVIGGAAITRGSHWDTATLAPNLATGTQTISVAAGDKPAANIDIRIVAGADRIAAITPPTQLYVNDAITLCFRASVGNTRVVGMPWTFTLNGAPALSTFVNNCTSVVPSQLGTATVVATAAGMSATLALPVVVNPRARMRADIAASPESDVYMDFGAAGERAQAVMVSR